jgi:hypothetical protein
VKRIEAKIGREKADKISNGNTPCGKNNRFYS